MTQFLIWGLSAFYASSAPRGELQLLFFLFLLQHFFSLSRVLFARCVASLLCAASCGLFYFIKAFLEMHRTDLCASYLCYTVHFPQPNAAISKFFLLSTVSSSFLLYKQLLKSLLKGVPKQLLFTLLCGF